MRQGRSCRCDAPLRGRVLALNRLVYSTEFKLTSHVQSCPILITLILGGLVVTMRIRVGAQCQDGYEAVTYSLEHRVVQSKISNYLQVQ